MTKLVLEDLEKCKAHGGPITEKDIHKLDGMTYDELIHEVGYLKRTIAPQLRLKQKVEGKMVKYTAEQLREQLRDVINPKNDSSHDINALLQAALNDDAPTISCDVESPTVEIGTRGLWNGPLLQIVFAVLLDSTTLQKYKKRRFGYVPDGLPEPIQEWTLQKPFTNNQFSYIERGNTIYIVLDSSS